jgi:hypothetical protein
MKETRIHFQWSPQTDPTWFRTGVSLHSHTLHSRESLNFFYRIAAKLAPVRYLLRQTEARYKAAYGSALNLNRGWWTPPLAPLDAHTIEFDRIKNMGLAPIVSITDHDDIEAPMSLQAVDASRRVPVSVEWTVPFRNTHFHVGLHNLRPSRARSTMSSLLEHAANPREGALKEILSSLHASPETLIVFNHPMWDEAGIGSSGHRAAAFEFVAQCGEFLHAVELNGLRPWVENKQVIQFARAWSKPLVAGGDRHAVEPNTMLNLTQAADFAGFADEIRHGNSNILIATPYREAHSIRIFHNTLDVLRTYPGHGFGWTEWPDRVFYTLEDGTVASLSQLWGGHCPGLAKLLTGLLHVAEQPRIRGVLRHAVSGTEEVFL